MKIFITTFFFAVLAAGAATGVEKTARNPDVLVVADALRDVPEGLRPTPGKPVYYVLGKSQLTVGNAVGGVKMPAPALVEKYVVEALASQGFVRTQVGGPLPAIFIIAAWGDANFANLDAPAEANDAEAVANADLLNKTTAASRDRHMIEQLVGTNKPGARSMSFEALDKLHAASNEDRLYISLAALDVPAFRQKQRVLLWRTSMSIDWRNNLADALPAMLASAAPFFGTNEDQPVFSTEVDRRKASVAIGEMKVVPDEPPPAAETKAKK